MITTTDSSPVADLATHERAMRELLSAAAQGVRQQLSLPAASAVAVAGAMPGQQCSTWPAIYRHAARYLRERCIRCGAPRSRYVGGEWLRLGL